MTHGKERAAGGEKLGDEMQTRFEKEMGSAGEPLTSKTCARILNKIQRKIWGYWS